MGCQESQSLAAWKQPRGEWWHLPCRVSCLPVVKWLSWAILTTDMSSEPLFENLHSRAVVTSFSNTLAGVYLWVLWSSAHTLLRYIFNMEVHMGELYIACSLRLQETSVIIAILWLSHEIWLWTKQMDSSLRGYEGQKAVCPGRAPSFVPLQDWGSIWKEVESRRDPYRLWCGFEIPYG